MTPDALKKITTAALDTLAALLDEGNKRPAHRAAQDDGAVPHAKTQTFDCGAVKSLETWHRVFLNGRVSKVPPHSVLTRPPQPDIDAAWIFANTVQGAVGAFLEPADPIRLFEAIHDVLRACPEALSRRHMSCSALCNGRLRTVAGPTHDDVRLPAGLTCVSGRTRVAEVLERILAWHSRPSLTLREIATFMGVRPEYLSESLNRVSHHTFFEHLHAVRVIHAAVALAETRDTGEQIARACGWFWAPQLNRHFKGLLHVTPRRFRSQCDANLRGVYTNPTQPQLRNPVVAPLGN